MQSPATMSLFTSPVAASPAMHEVMRRYHSRHKAPGQCGSANVLHVAAPLPVVWSLLRRFDRRRTTTGSLRDAGCAPGTAGWEE
ncbi:abscisic acid receptor [Musa troglodytarum]|uniref:Abscisic acid receptor n=1 Tax=Musa troglodytarum TaxID=320322 RepID=A0A9E7FMI8_9LILI|nr:abscisic acid receptor [Musa troglodytarum]